MIAFTCFVAALAGQANIDFYNCWDSINNYYIVVRAVAVVTILIVVTVKTVVAALTKVTKVSVVTVFSLNQPIHPP